jgi:hypothetical protein
MVGLCHGRIEYERKRGSGIVGGRERSIVGGTDAKGWAIRHTVRFTPIKVGAGLAVLVALIGFVSLQNYHTNLCNGYRFVRMNGYEVVIANQKNDVLTRGTVAMFAVKSPLVTGYTSSKHMSPDTDPVDGYFLLDTVSGTVDEGMTERAWRQKLSELLWEHPAMRRPW